MLVFSKWQSKMIIWSTKQRKKMIYIFFNTSETDGVHARRFRYAAAIFLVALTGPVWAAADRGGEGVPGLLGSSALPNLSGSRIVQIESEQEWMIMAMRPERDPEAVLQDVFDEAVRNHTAGALIKFISRNPNHPLADKARRLLETGKYAPARQTATEFFDSKIVEFDAARRLLEK
jgi:hypothetical protein